VKIDSKLTSPLTGEVAGDSRATAKGSGRPGADAPQAPGVEVQLSPLASQMQAVEASLANAPSIDLAKVAEISQAIQEGRLQINPGAIADKLLQTVRELIKGYGH
jgi:negative regulator of flagellin synthesis FlgM